MMHPKQMKKVRLIVLKSVVDGLLKDLHEAGFVDIRKTIYQGLDEGRPLSSFDDISAALLRLRGIHSLMESVADTCQAPLLEGLDALKASKNPAIIQAETKLRSLADESMALNDRLKELESFTATVKKTAYYYDFDFSRLKSRTIDYYFGEISIADAVVLKSKLEAIPDNQFVNKNKTCIIVYDKKNENQIDSLLAQSGFVALDLPSFMATPQDTLDHLKSDYDRIIARLHEIKSAQSDISRQHVTTVRSLIYSLEVAASRTSISSHFATSRYAYVVDGWILACDSGKLGSILSKYGNSVSLEYAHIDPHHDLPPTVLDNPKQAGPFEFITNTYSFPNYYELDPTMAYMIGFPILYGMIIGDVFYGLMSLLLAFFIYKKFQKSYVMKNVSIIWMISAIPTILFGLIFNEWAGMPIYRLVQTFGAFFHITAPSFLNYFGLARVENVPLLLGITMLVGLLHLAIGFIFGAINEWNHNKIHSFAKISWLGVELGGFLAVGSFMSNGLIPSSMLTPGAVLLILSVIGLSLTEGILGILELPGIVGNVLSYTRIASVGVVGVVLAELINKFLLPSPAAGLIIILILPLYILLHALNCFIAMFESIIQGGRLNIVEFRNKFMHGGGSSFMPFSNTLIKTLR